MDTGNPCTYMTLDKGPMMKAPLPCDIDNFILHMYLDKTTAFRCINQCINARH